MQQIRSQSEWTGRKLEWLKMHLAANDDIPIFSTGLNASGFSENHDDLPELLRKIENATSKRREVPFLTSEPLVEDVLFSIKQLAKKGRPHLENEWNYPSEVLDRMSDRDVALVYLGFIETIYEEGFNADYIHKIEAGTAQFREPASLIINEKTGFCITFETNPFYPDVFHFISSYRFTRTQETELLNNKNLGLSL